MSKQLSLVVPEGFDPALLREIQEKYGLNIREDEVPSSAENNPSETSPKSSSTFEPVILESPFPHLPPRILAKIANQLDPRSLLNLARSCHQLYDFYRQPSSNNIVEIRLDKETLVICEDGDVGFTFKYDSELVPSSMGPEETEVFLAGLACWPFSLHMKRVVLEDNLVPYARQTLTRIGVKSIRELEIGESVPCLAIVSLIEDYEVKRFESNGSRFVFRAEGIETLLQMPLEYVKMSINCSLLVAATVPNLKIFDSDVRAEDLSAIIKKFLTTDDLVDWELRHFLSVGEVVTTSFTEYPLLSVNYPGLLPDQRPLAFVSCVDNQDFEEFDFYILRADGRIVQIVFEEDDLHIKFCPLAEAPAILRPV